MYRKIVLFTNRKSHTGFRLVRISMTLNGVMTADPRYLCAVCGIAELLVHLVRTICDLCKKLVTKLGETVVKVRETVSLFQKWGYTPLLYGTHP